MSKLVRRKFLLGSSALLAGCAAGPPADQVAAALQAQSQAGTGPFEVSTDGSVVFTRSGLVQGYIRGGVEIFKGIPYGAPTGPGSRFAPAQPAAAWQGVRRALVYGPVCPVGSAPKADLSANEWPFMIPNGPVTSEMEDCLRINIWSPVVDAAANLPVMLWLHADGFGGGSSQDFLSTDGESLARQQKVVIASINHRVGALGFANFSVVDDALADSMNVGMLDIVQALRWLQDNIRGFGGNPDNVTVFGQSGGGFKISVLLAMPSARGLFHKAIIQSGARMRVHDVETSQQLGAAVLQELGLVPGLKAREALQGMQLPSFFAAVERASNKVREMQLEVPDWQSPAWWFEPAAGTPSLPKQPFDPVASAESAHIPLLCGTTLNELNPAVNAPEIEQLSWDALQQRLQPELAGLSASVIAACRSDFPAATPADVLSLVASRRFRLAAVALCDRVAARNTAPVWNYIFAWQSPLFEGRPRAFHTSDVAFVFANTDLVDTQTGGGERPRRLSRLMSASWAEFARSGNPQTARLPIWPAWTSTQRQCMWFDDECQVLADPDGRFISVFQ